MLSGREQQVTNGRRRPRATGKSERHTPKPVHRMWVSALARIEPDCVPKISQDLIIILDTKFLKLQ